MDSIRSCIKTLEQVERYLEIRAADPAASDAVRAASDHITIALERLHSLPPDDAAEDRPVVAAKTAAKTAPAPRDGRTFSAGPDVVKRMFEFFASLAAVTERVDKKAAEPLRKLDDVRETDGVEVAKSFAMYLEENYAALEMEDAEIMASPDWAYSSKITVHLKHILMKIDQKSSESCFRWLNKLYAGMYPTTVVAEPTAVAGATQGDINNILASVMASITRGVGIDPADIMNADTAAPALKKFMTQAIPDMMQNRNGSAGNVRDILAANNVSAKKIMRLMRTQPTKK